MGQTSPATPAATSGRLFLALWPGDAERAQVAAWRDAAAWPPGARLVATPDLHLTLHFLGVLPVDAAHRLPEHLADVACEPFDLVLDHGQAWRNGVASLAPSRSPPPLHARLGECLRRAGLPTEARAYRPHVTLARQARDVRFVAGVPASWSVTGFVLATSMPAAARAGSTGRYRVLWQSG